LAGSIQQYREDEVNGVLQVALTNNGPSPVRIQRVELDWPGFAEPPAADPAYRIGPGLTADLPLPLAAADCSAVPNPQLSGPATPAIARVEVDGGGLVRVPLPASGALERVFTTDCRRQHTAAQVDLAFGSDWARAGAGAGAVLTGTLDVTRREAVGEVGVVSVDGSVLLGLALVGTPGPGSATLAPGQASTRLPVEVRSTLRCDGHSLGESKQTYVFDVVVDLGDGEARPYALTPDPAARALMQSVIEDACGL
jgi:hypothetical protein